eukprot:PLAT12539.55.p1 GENE.PLAT12539.55~~PLAT12539.55.p1  ORF type:complete len:1323 (-),score=660.58 PLAT12539.55:56-3820(-)
MAASSRQKRRHGVRSKLATVGRNGSELDKEESRPAAAAIAEESDEEEAGEGGDVLAELPSAGSPMSRVPRRLSKLTSRITGRKRADSEDYWKAAERSRRFSIRYARNVNLQKDSRRRRLQRYLATSMTGVAMDVINAILSLAGCVAYVIDTYNNEDTLQTGVSAFEVTLTSYFALDFLLRVYIAEHLRDYLLSSEGIIDLLTSLPLVFGLATLRGLAFFRFARVLRALRIVRVHRLLPYFDSEISQQLWKMFFTIISIVFVSTCLVHLVENTFREDSFEQLEMHDSFYFVVVTMSTVGYGDIRPETLYGKMLVVVLMAGMIVLIPRQTNQLLSIIDMQTKYARKSYKPQSGVVQVLICGSVDTPSFSGFLRELLHEDHGFSQIHVVILSPAFPSKRMLAVISDTRFAPYITYLEGSAMLDKDLMRAKAEHADTCFVLTDKLSRFPSEDDAASVLISLNVKRFVFQRTALEIPVQLQMLLPSNVERFLGDRQGIDREVCIEEIKMNILAKSCLCPGISTMVYNLVSSRSGLQLRPELQWFAEYQEGVQYEIYKTPISREFDGLPFPTAALAVYEETRCVLFALQLPSGDGVVSPGSAGDNRGAPAGAPWPGSPRSKAEAAGTNKTPIVLLNPVSYNIRWSRGCMGFVIAQDKTVADMLRLNLSYSRATTRNADGYQATVERLRRRLMAERTAMMEGRSGSSRRPTMTRSMGGRMTAAALAMSEGMEAVPGRRAASVAGDGRGGAAGAGGRSLWRTFSRLGSVRPADSAAIEHKLFHMLPEPLSLDEAMVRNADGILGLDNHIVVTGSMNNLLYFLRPLRVRFLRSLHPIVLLHPERLTLEQWQPIASFPDVYFVHGDPLEMEALQRAGVSTAAKVVVLAAQRHGGLGEDSAALFTYTNLRRLNPQMEIVVELLDDGNVAFLSDSHTLASAGRGDFVLSPPFAAGHIYASSIPDVLLCQTFFNSALVKVLEKLVTGVEKDLDLLVTESQLHQIAVPPGLVGKRYGEVFRQLLSQDGTLCLAIMRGVLPALATGEGGNRLPFVYTNPHPDKLLTAVDRLFVLTQQTPDSVMHRNLGSYVHDKIMYVRHVSDSWEMHEQYRSLERDFESIPSCELRARLDSLERGMADMRMAIERLASGDDDDDDDGLPRHRSGISSHHSLRSHRTTSHRSLGHHGSSSDSTSDDSPDIDAVAAASSSLKKRRTAGAGSALEEKHASVAAAAAAAAVAAVAAVKGPRLGEEEVEEDVVEVVDEMLMEM